MTTKAILNASPALRVRLATPADRPRLVELINSAFAIERFIEGTRTSDDDLTGLMAKGSFLIAEDNAGRLLASGEPRAVLKEAGAANFEELFIKKGARV